MTDFVVVWVPNMSRSTCVLRSIAIYRYSHDGAWIWRNLYAQDDYGHLPIDPSRRQVAKPPADEEVETANRLVRASKVPRECVILTVTPNSEIDADACSIAMAGLLRANVDLPQVDDLYTWDNSHLTWSSAQRWSQKFMQDVDPIIRRCAGGRK